MEIGSSSDDVLDDGVGRFDGVAGRWRVGGEGGVDLSPQGGGVIGGDGALDGLGRAASVRKPLGSTSKTRMPKDCTSWASASEMPSTANFEAL